MSLLDGMFDSGAELTVSPIVIMSDTTLEPGFLYIVYGTDEPRVLTIASHELEAVAGKRIAVKVVIGNEAPPATLTIVAPSAMTIEGEPGNLLSTATIPDGQKPGTYAEWLCDDAGHWYFVHPAAAVVDSGGGALMVQEEGAPVGARGTLNFIGGVVTAVDNPTEDRVDITVLAEPGVSVEDEGTFVATTPTINFIGPNVTAAYNEGADRVDVTLVAPAPVPAITVAKAGVAIGTRGRLNLIEGANATLTVTDDALNNEIDVTITAIALVDAPVGFAWAGASASINVGAARNFAATNTLTATSTLTLTGGVDGCSGVIFVKHDATTSAWAIVFAAAGRTQMRDFNVADTNPLAVANSVTMYQYFYVTIAGTAYIVINKVPMQ